MLNPHNIKHQLDLIYYKCLKYSFPWLDCIVIRPLRTNEWPVFIGLGVKSFRSAALMRHKAKGEADIEYDIDKFVPSFD